MLEAVSIALYEDRWLTLSYRNAARTIKKITVMPLALAQQGVRLYLVCRYQGYNDNRTLVLHRILNAKACTMVFQRPQDFNLAQFEAEGGFNISKGNTIQLTFMITAKAGRHLYETPLSSDQTITETEDGLRVSATVIDSERLNWWLNGFGESVWSVLKE